MWWEIIAADEMTRAVPESQLNPSTFPARLEVGSSDNIQRGLNKDRRSTAKLLASSQVVLVVKSSSLVVKESQLGILPFNLVSVIHEVPDSLHP